MPHISASRLVVIMEQGASFTNSEFVHLKRCPECLDVWSELIQEKVRGDDCPPAKSVNSVAPEQPKYRVRYGER